MKRIVLMLAILAFTASCSKVKLVSPTTTDEELPELKQGAEIVRVNDTVLRDGYLDLLANINPRVKNQISNPMMKKKLVENLVDQELLYQESVRRGLSTKKDILAKAALYKRIVIAQALLEEEMTRKAREYYEKNKEADFTKIQIAQIQFDFKKPEATPSSDEEKDDKEEKQKADSKEPPTEAEKKAALEKAKAIKTRLVAGEDFAKLAEEASDDNSSKRKGGDLGKVSRDDKRMARRGWEKLVESAFALKMGEVSEPIETEKGVHLVKVTSAPETTPFEEAEKAIQFQLQKQVKDELLASLKQTAKIVYAAEAAQPQSGTAPTPPVTAPVQMAPAQPGGELVQPTAPAGGEAQPMDEQVPTGVVTDPPAPEKQQNENGDSVPAENQQKTLPTSPNPPPMAVPAPGDASPPANPPSVPGSP